MSYIAFKNDGLTRTDQNMVGSHLESSMRTAIHGKSRVSSAISVKMNWIELSALSFFTILNKISDCLHICGDRPVD